MKYGNSKCCLFFRLEFACFYQKFIFLLQQCFDEVTTDIFKTYISSFLHHFHIISHFHLSNLLLSLSFSHLMIAINFKFIPYNVKWHGHIFWKIRKTLFEGPFRVLFSKICKDENFPKKSACQFLTIINRYLDDKNQKKVSGFWVKLKTDRRKERQTSRQGRVKP